MALFYWRGEETGNPSVAAICTNCGKMVLASIKEAMHSGMWQRSDGVWHMVCQFGRNVLRWRIVITIFRKG